MRINVTVVGMLKKLGIGLCVTLTLAGCANRNPLTHDGSVPPSSVVSTTTSTVPISAEMAGWLGTIKAPYAALATDVQTINIAVKAVAQVNADGTSSAATLRSALGNGACSGLGADLTAAGALPGAPIPIIQTDWQSQLSSFSAIYSACDAATTGHNPGFVQQWPTLSQTIFPPAAKLNADLGNSGYCYPSAVCGPPYRTT